MRFAAALIVLVAIAACNNGPESNPTDQSAHVHHDHDHASQDARDHTHGGCNDHVVIAAATGLGAIGGAAVAPLLERIRSGVEPNRTFAGFALARLRSSAVPALRGERPAPDRPAGARPRARTTRPCHRLRRSRPPERSVRARRNQSR